MKAEDTVMGDKDTVYIANNGTPYTIGILKSQCVSNVNSKWVTENIDLIREAQAEISFKAGIKEVVEWLKQYAIYGGASPLSSVLDDLKIHSPYGG